ncbi:MAG: tetratricopeptide repeat protein [Alphaproteobacteria bacterium]|nr:tetratricopeptide repeat protein [Alphaproteobacteria bacterium]
MTSDDVRPMNRRDRRATVKAQKGDAAELFDAGALHMKEGGFALAEVCFRRALQMQPTREAHHNLGYVLTERGAFAEAIRHYRAAIKLAPDDQRHHNSIVKPLLLSGFRDEALKEGQITLTLKDREVMQAAAETHPEPSGGQARGPRRKDVIAFSIWGSNAFYTLGAIKNAQLAKVHYPSWVTRFHHDDSVPSDVLERLRSEGDELVPMAPHRDTQLGPYWRFMVSDDPEVRHFLVRDVDSRLGERERVAVEAWIRSGRDFHVMRDHPLNCELVLGGMWGGRAGVLPNMARQAASWVAVDPQRLNTRYDDQRFLRFVVWPLIRERSLTHDAFYRFLDAIDFPPGVPWTEETFVARTVSPFKS